MRLKNEFSEVKARLIENAITGNIPVWTAAAQIEALQRRVQARKEVQEHDRTGKGKQRES